MRRVVAVLQILLLLAAPAAAQERDAADYAEGLELFRAGRYAAALPYFRKSLELAEARYGAENPAIAIELNNLAEVYRLMGRLDEAEALYRRAIQLDTRTRDNSPGLATSLNNLALVYRTQGRLDEAEDLYVRSLDLLEKALGPGHPDVARGLNNLAVLYRMKGERERARPLQERALAIAESTLGHQHPTTEVLRGNLAALDRTPAKAAAPAPAPKPLPEAGLPEPVLAMAAVEETPPAAPPEPEAVPPSAPVNGAASAGAGGFAVQVAAVADEAQVAREWQRLAARYPVLRELGLQAPQQVEVAGKGTFWRVLAGSFPSREEAQAICERLRTAGAACRLARL